MKDGRNAPPEIISAHCDAWRYSSLLSFVHVLQTSEIWTKDRWSWKWDSKAYSSVPNRRLFRISIHCLRNLLAYRPDST